MPVVRLALRLVPVVLLAFSAWAVPARAEMSEADRLKDLETAAFERGKDAQRAESMAARMPAPGVPGPGMSGTIPKVDPTKGELGDLYAEANKDPELRALMEQMGSFSN